jgi:hypothetical protein
MVESGQRWCRGPESNWGHADFQSAALPTELPRHKPYFSFLPSLRQLAWIRGLCRGWVGNWPLPSPYQREEP